ncbi:hypothetical protein DINM_003392 [Dirofilaria immitis]|nr:hypothetical protein [Dirofilaria immitis]
MLDEKYASSYRRSYMLSGAKHGDGADFCVEKAFSALIRSNHDWESQPEHSQMIKNVYVLAIGEYVLRQKSYLLVVGNYFVAFPFAANINNNNNDNLTIIAVIIIIITD